MTGTPYTSEERSRRGLYGIDENGLTPSQQRIWRAISEVISVTGLSPTHAMIAERAGLQPHQKPATYVKRLVDKGLIRRTGIKRTVVLHVLIWPDGVAPRKTEGRADKAAKQFSKAPTAQPIERRAGDHRCATEGCGFTRQPGRDRCASCITAAARLNRRQHMRDAL